MFGFVAIYEFIELRVGYVHISEFSLVAFEACPASKLTVMKR